MTANTRLPTYFISHGGGPWPWIKEEMGGGFGPLEASLRSVARELGSDASTILVISGHWEEPRFTVQTNPNPPMLYDYYGFPESTYHIQYPAPGSPAVASRVTELLTDAGIAVRSDPHRGFDHGVFAPLYVMYPNADMPILQLSLRSGHDPAEHLEVGRALAPLRDEGVAIIGSGFSFHNLRMFGPAAAEPSKIFEQWLTRTVTTQDPSERTEAMLDWYDAPAARTSHPSADHLIPLMVALGAAESERGERIYHESAFMGSVTSASYRFGEVPDRTASGSTA